MITVTLTKEEVHQCVDAAKHRWLGKWGSIDKPSYAGDNKKYMEHDLLASLRSAVTEWAVAKQLNQGWIGQVTYPNSLHPGRKHLPDVGTNIEVRSRRTRDGTPVWDYDVVEGKILVGTQVVDDATFSEVNVFGWLPMTKVPEVGEYFENRYYVPIDAFLPLEDLNGGAF